MKQSILIVIKSAPYAMLAGQEALDLALAVGSYEQPISLLFVGDGAYHLLPKQNAAAIGAKPYMDTFKALPFYDVEDIFVEQQALAQRSIDIQQAFFDVELANSDKTQQLINNANKVIVL